MTARSFTVETCYQTQNGEWRVFLRDHTLPVPTDGKLTEGQSVLIVEGRAVAR